MAEISLQINYTDYKNKLIRYLKVLYQFHKLADREIEVLAEIIIKYKEYTNKYSQEIADKLIFSTDTRKEIKKNLGGMADSLFLNHLTNLRKKKVLSSDNKIVPILIPPDNDFDLNIKFIDGRNSKGSSKKTKS